MKIMIISLIITAVLIGLEHFLSAKMRSPLWGGIIPLILVIATAYIFKSGLIELSFSTLIPFIFLISFMIGDWVSGREKYKKNQKSEIKMNAKYFEY